jgi:hypothetical protein
MRRAILFLVVIAICFAVSANAQQQNTDLPEMQVNSQLNEPVNVYAIVNSSKIKIASYLNANESRDIKIQERHLGADGTLTLFVQPIGGGEGFTAQFTYSRSQNLSLQLLPNGTGWSVGLRNPLK